MFLAFYTISHGVPVCLTLSCWTSPCSVCVGSNNMICLQTNQRIRDNYPLRNRLKCFVANGAFFVGAEEIKKVYLK